MVNVAVTRTRTFNAASSGDGGFLEPSGYAGWPASYDPVYGGSPMSEHFEQYRRFAPSLNAMNICTPVRSEEHTSELQSLMRISYAVFCLKKTNIQSNPILHF